MRCPFGIMVAFLLLLGQVPTVESSRVWNEGRSVMAAEGEQRRFADSDQAEAKVGLVLRDRYVLTSFVQTRGNHSVETDVNSANIPGISFPLITRRGLDRPKHLGTGSFGDVWAAYDRKLQKEVAVKIFYRKQPTKSYATWSLARTDPRLSEELEANIKECSLIKDILSHRRMYPVGATRICACFDEHISDVRAPQDQNRVVFLVQEMCGRDLRSEYLQYHQQRGTKDLDLARNMVMQMLEGIAYLNMFNPPMIHHDLKPENVVMHEGNVKIIDWGGLVFAKSSTQYEPAVCTPAYMPPEAERGPTFEWGPRGEAWPYDVYAIGLMFMEFVCPQLDFNTWYRYRPLNSFLVKDLVRRYCPRADSEMGRELNLIGAMITPDPRRRIGPEDALSNPIFKEDEFHQTADLSDELSKFTVGMKVQYWSESLRVWASVFIVGFNRQQNCYKLKDIALGTIVFDCCPAWKIREPPNNVAVNEALHVPVHRVPDDDNDKANGDILHGNQVLWPVHGNAGGGFVGGKGGLGQDRVYVELSLVHQSRTADGTLRLKTEFTCLHPAKCGDYEVTLECAGAQALHFKAVHVLAAEKTALMDLYLNRRDTARLNKVCSVEAVSMVTTDGASWFKQRAYPKRVSTYLLV